MNGLRTIATKAIGMVNQPLAQRRMVRALTATPVPHRIEVGAHSTRRPGWICTDISWRSRHYLDAAAPWPLPDSSASHVYADNVIEHLGLDDNRAFFQEVHRVLMPGSGVRLVTPDVARIARIYLDGGSETEWHLENMRQRGYFAAHPVDLLRSAFQDCGHHTGYLWDFDALTAELHTAGFSAVHRCEVGTSDDPAFEGLEARPDRAQSPIFLVVEARTSG